MNIQPKSVSDQLNQSMLTFRPSPMSCSISSSLSSLSNTKIPWQMQKYKRNNPPFFHHCLSSTLKSHGFCFFVRTAAITAFVVVWVQRTWSGTGGCKIPIGAESIFHNLFPNKSKYIPNSCLFQKKRVSKKLAMALVRTAIKMSQIEARVLTWHWWAH